MLQSDDEDPPWSIVMPTQCSVFLLHSMYCVYYPRRFFFVCVHKNRGPGDPMALLPNLVKWSCAAETCWYVCLKCITVHGVNWANGPVVRVSWESSSKHYHRKSLTPFSIPSTVRVCQSTAESRTTALVRFPWLTTKHDHQLLMFHDHKMMWCQNSLCLWEEVCLQDVMFSSWFNYPKRRVEKLNCHYLNVLYAFGKVKMPASKCTCNWAILTILRLLWSFCWRQINVSVDHQK